MKLWQLELVGTFRYAFLLTVVVRAETEAEARRLAAEYDGAPYRNRWLDPALTSCAELLPSGEAGVISADYNPQEV